MAFWTTCTLDCRPVYCSPSMLEQRMPGDVPQLCHCIGTLAAARAHLAANSLLTSTVRRACCIVACSFVTACPFVLSNCMLPTAARWRRTWSDDQSPHLRLHWCHILSLPRRPEAGQIFPLPVPQPVRGAFRYVRPEPVHRVAGRRSRLDGPTTTPTASGGCG